MTKRLLAHATLALFTVMLLTTPALALAQDAAGPASGAAAGHPVLTWILLGLAAATAVVTAATNLFPGWGTRLNIAAGVLASITAALTDLAQTNPNATLGAIGLALIGALFGYNRSEARARASG